MTRRQDGKLHAMWREECASDNEESTGTLVDYCRERHFEIAFATNLERKDSQPERATCLLDVAQLGLGIEVWI
jgi:hypothetical protein